VVVAGDKIEAVGSRIATPPGAAVVEGHGRTRPFPPRRTLRRSQTRASTKAPTFSRSSTTTGSPR
jgi:hypothetical protein